MNVCLLAPILGYMSEIIRGEMSEAVRAHEKLRTVELGVAS